MAGGSANVAVPMARLGGKVAVIGRVGKDSFGDEYKADLERNQIVSQVDPHQSLGTGLVVSIVSCNAERTMLVSRGGGQMIRSILQSSRNLFPNGDPRVFSVSPVILSPTNRKETPF